MNIKLSEEQQVLCDAIKDTCEKYLNKDVFEEDEKEVFNREKWSKLGELGIFSLPFEEELGGLNVDAVTTTLAIYTLARYCKDEGLVFSVVAQLSATQIPLWIHGTEEQKKKYLMPIITGEKIGASVISEPEAGSDASGMEAKIRKTDKTFILDGTKTFATLSPVSDILLVYAKHPNGIKMLDISALIMEKGEYEIGQVFQKSGLRTSPMGEVVLSNSEIPLDRLVGSERRAMSIFMDAMMWEKLLMGAYHVGAMEQQYYDVYNYAKQREQFGKPIIEFENIYNMLVNMRMRVETGKLMMFDVSKGFGKNQGDKYGAAMLKLHTAESKLKNSLEAAEIMGTYGFLKESNVEKQVRDSLASGIYSGTNQMQRRILYNKLGD
ncbi:acyl-CoA dehydrogenase family protein [Clostridium felsineum]|uniref:L-prolyl-[peptidyl-carrier protein] dehydrogenase n=1 Tax=Clostridium felsineum TaxID=36839 RepID=A0A1S8L2B9_9CLOT|nr:acyl-CoA dehydrogenase family protein [Clostridium felsineum]MCR3757609.1 acyl-CoA/acyl-ACP dehydrogenase [Clostridium felsineum]URZ08454.1 L-prolyl-[peptidyl-carrier protein] dehydrogenase [Clostridium felsineum]URZ13485.1 L-prolyl-[peptidyl-carrier protein] dehydrogenase [Clostridium felsineum]